MSKKDDVNVEELLEEIKKLKGMVKSGGSGRKEVLKGLMLEGEFRSSKEYGELMSESCGCVISDRNIGSLKCYLKKDIVSGVLKDMVIVNVGSGGNCKFKMIKKGEEGYDIFKSMM